MRAAIAVLMAGVIAPAHAVAETCETAGERGLLDRSAIANSAEVFGATESSVFRFRLDAGEPMPIARHTGIIPASLRLSPKKRWLSYRSEEPASYVYDLENAREHRLDIGSAAPVEPELSPDETLAAWLEENGAARRLAIADLETFTLRRIALPMSPDPKAVFFDLTWAGDGRSLTYAWRDSDRQEFFRVAVTGIVAMPIPPLREFGADEFAEGAYLLGKPLKPARPIENNPGTDKIALASGVVQRDNRSITLSLPGSSPRAIASSSAACGEVALLAAFGGRYVLYRTGGMYWLYGVAEDRSAILYRGPGPLVW